MDKVLKQRLVGASILIALAVIFLPMLFEGGEDDAAEQRELVIDVPERESGDRQVRRLALDPEQARRPPDESQAQPPESSRPEPAARQPEPQPVEAESGESRVERPAREQPAQEDEVAATGDSTSARSDAQPEAAPEPDAVEPEAVEPSAEADTRAQPETPRETPDETSSAPAMDAVEGRWVVQVAVFSSRDTANQIRQRLSDLGHRVSMDVLIRDQAELFRLRTGPYADEATAEQARGQIAATVAGVDPVTRELSGGGSAEDRHGLAVQVGSFASHNNAERLVSQLNGAGFDAFMYGEETGGRTIWRVRVGGYEQRADAERLLETLRNEQGLEGIVVSHP
ncbi:SPOR domain-containing protein [Wenzhouxiangella sediminis]|uniref:SPOR domain-containing protein n=1 Tax=Wenzhouxiangella sediminis TaxID=1792836 RepID=A0A3E1K7N7_9GAMM|nr:SPOR domain-containing protein [Wenzhouxiangella sediminis]RFF30056.1 SPOR domain-containing protein [Wenzhouxiangella sediminis]